MRIISQNKKLDAPYEVATLRIVSANKEYCVLACTQNMDYEIAFYSTEGKAVKAMEMCREQYAQCEINKHLIQKAADNLEGISITLTGEVRNQLADKYLFQFPADGEI